MATPPCNKCGGDCKPRTRHCTVKSCRQPNTYTRTHCYVHRTHHDDKTVHSCSTCTSKHHEAPACPGLGSATSPVPPPSPTPSLSPTPSEHSDVDDPPEVSDRKTGGVSASATDDTDTTTSPSKFQLVSVSSLRQTSGSAAGRTYTLSGVLRGDAVPPATQRVWQMHEWASTTTDDVMQTTADGAVINGRLFRYTATHDLGFTVCGASSPVPTAARATTAVTRSAASTSTVTPMKLTPVRGSPPPHAGAGGSMLPFSPPVPPSFSNPPSASRSLAPPASTWTLRAGTKTYLQYQVSRLSVVSWNAPSLTSVTLPVVLAALPTAHIVCLQEVNNTLAAHLRRGGEAAVCGWFVAVSDSRVSPKQANAVLVREVDGGWLTPVTSFTWGAGPESDDVAGPTGARGTRWDYPPVSCVLRVQFPSVDPFMLLVSSIHVPGAENKADRRTAELKAVLQSAFPKAGSRSTTATRLLRAAIPLAASGAASGTDVRSLATDVSNWTTLVCGDANASQGLVVGEDGSGDDADDHVGAAAAAGAGGGGPGTRTRSKASASQSFEEVVQVSGRRVGVARPGTSTPKLRSQDVLLYDQPVGSAMRTVGHRSVLDVGHEVVFGLHEECGLLCDRDKVPTSDHLPVLFHIHFKVVTA